MTKFLNEAEIPENFPIPVGRICGVGKVLETNSTEGWLRIYTVSFDRVAGTRRSFELIAYRLPEARWKNTPQFPVNSTIFFSGELYSQQPTTKLFTIVLDDATWMVQTGGGNNTTPASTTTTRPRSVDLAPARTSTRPSRRTALRRRPPAQRPLPPERRPHAAHCTHQITTLNDISELSAFTSHLRFPLML
ncbi:unnamed protein product [Tilletia controversa]|nr:unnamed protein product [Tilletia caries]CAD6921355.1 unnamed protein product [Tilletia controversa]